MQSQHPTNIELSPEIQSKLEDLAKHLDISPLDLISKAIDSYSEQTKKWRRTLARDVLESKEHITRTGLHLTGEEVDEWLGQIAEGKRVEMPKCHK